MGKGVKKYLFALFLALIVVYAIGVYYYSSHFSHNTIINGLNLGGLTPKEAAKAVASHTDEYYLRLNEKNTTEYIQGEDIGLSLDMTNEVNELFGELNPLFWPKNLFLKENHTVIGHVSYDEGLLKKQVAKLKCFKRAEDPKDAYIKLDGEKYIIVPEEEGTVVKKKKLTEEIQAAIENFREEIGFEEKGLYKEPKVNRENEKLIKACSLANQYASAKITYLPEALDEVLDFDITRDWITMDKDMEVSLNENQVAEYVEQLAEKYNTDHITFEKHDGGVLEFQGDGFTTSIDKDKETQSIINNIKSGQEVSRKPAFSQKGAVLGNTYIEFSKGTNHVWIVKDGYVFSESNVLAGDITDGLHTVSRVSEDSVLFDGDKGFVVQGPTDTALAPEGELGSTEAIVKPQTDNIECTEAFFQNIKDNATDGMPVVVY